MMSASEIKQHLAAIIDDMPESKLEALLDFASYLKERSQGEEYWALQRSSKAYREWLGSENDVYDVAFQVEPEKGKL